MTATTISSPSESAETAEVAGPVELPLAAAKVLYRMVADIRRREAEQVSEAA